MKPQLIKRGDRISVKPYLSTMPEHWGEVDHIHKGGAVMY